MVFRLLAGLGAAGVERVLMMPAADGALRRRCTASCAAAHATLAGAARSRSCRCSTARSTGTARGHASTPSRAMCARGRRARSSCSAATARTASWPQACGDVPLCALSTGTNNAFPEMREATVAGLAAGLVATGRAGASRAAPRGRARGRASAAPRDLALVDVAVSARALRRRAGAVARGDGVSELFVDARAARARSACRRSPGCSRRSPRRGRGLHVRLAPPRRGRASCSHVAARARASSTPVGVAEHRPLELGDAVRASRRRGHARARRRARDRAPPRRRGRRVRLRRARCAIDVDAVMRAAARRRNPRATSRV